jgi:hypothetical protein
MYLSISQAATSPISSTISTARIVGFAALTMNGDIGLIVYPALSNQPQDGKWLAP